MGCSIWAPDRRAASRTLPGRCGRRSSGHRASSTWRCRRHCARSTSISRRHAWSGCARRDIRGPSPPWRRAYATTFSATCHSLIATADPESRSMQSGLRHVILDRDGVLNHEAEGSGYVREPSQFHWLPGALEGLATLRRAGLRLTVVTNQSGVGRGLMTLEQLAAVHARMQEEAAAHGAALDAVLFCPHAPEEGCSCRKPAPGLIQAAIARSGIAAADSIVVGDDGR